MSANNPTPELNPNHPVTRELNDQWHKIAALIMRKHGIVTTDITVADIEHLNATKQTPTVIAHAKSDRLTITLFDTEREALEYAVKQQGRG